MRLIDADATKSLVYISPSAWGRERDLMRVIDSVPTIDATPVVRCKDCAEYIPWLRGNICGLLGSYYGDTKPNDFCSRGRRKEKAGD